MSIGKRLLEQRKLAGYSSQEQLGDALGVSFTTIARWEKDQSPIPSDKLIGMNALGLDAVYILTGKTGDVAGFQKPRSRKNNEIAESQNTKPATSPVLGDEIVADQMADGTWRVRSSSGEILRGTTDEVIRHLRERAAPYEAGRDRTPDVNDYAWIPLYDVEVSAGGGRFFDGENVLTYLAFTKYSLRKQGLQPDMLACVRVSGDSMEPTIQSNDAVMIDMRQTTADSGIFVFRVGEVLYLKRLVREGAGVRVISDNDIYPSWLIQPGEDFQIVGKRVWHARWGE